MFILDFIHSTVIYCKLYIRKHHAINSGLYNVIINIIILKLPENINKMHNILLLNIIVERHCALGLVRN